MDCPQYSEAVDRCTGVSGAGRERTSLPPLGHCGLGHPGTKGTLSHKLQDFGQFLFIFFGFASHSPAEAHASQLASLSRLKGLFFLQQEFWHFAFMNLGLLPHSPESAHGPHWPDVSTSAMKEVRHSSRVVRARTLPTLRNMSPR